MRLPNLPIVYFFAGGSDEKTGELMAAIKTFKK